MKSWVENLTKLTPYVCCFWLCVYLLRSYIVIFNFVFFNIPCVCLKKLFEDTILFKANNLFELENRFKIFLREIRHKTQMSLSDWVINETIKSKLC